MLVVDRPTRPGDPPSRVSRLAGDLPGVTRTSGPDEKDLIGAAGRHGEPVYFVDNTRLAAAFAARFPRSNFVVDIGDDVASLWSTRGVARGRVIGAYVVQRLIERRARGVVCRGLGQAGALRALGIVNVVTIPDLPSVDVGSTCHAPGSCRHLGFIGSSHLSPGARPAGWEIPDLLAVLPPPYEATLIAVGDGLEEITAAAEARGVQGRLHLVPGCSPSELSSAFDRVGIAISSQTFNLAGEVRTTGKLPDYLAMGKVVVASRVGTAGAILPTHCTVVARNLYSEEYVLKVARIINQLAAVPSSEWISLSEYNRSLAQRLFAPGELGSTWRESLALWGMI